MKEKWEYTYCKSTPCKIDELITKLNREGEDGWELIQILKGKSKFFITAIFKRKVIQE